MIETSTPETDSLQEKDLPNEDLNPDEEIFYSSIKSDLNAILVDPKPETIKKIMNYSKSSR